MSVIKNNDNTLPLVLVMLTWLILAQICLLCCAFLGLCCARMSIEGNEQADEVAKVAELRRASATSV